MKKSLLMLSLLTLSSWVLAQDNEPEASNTSETNTKASWSDTEQKIEVNQTVSDQAIEKRFASILKVSERIQEAGIEVTEGVLVLTGWTNDEADKEWVENAANRTEGVIAVVNNIELRMGSEQWDLQPAVNEAVSLYDKFIRSIPKLTIALFILFLTWLLAKLAVYIADKVLQNRTSNPFILRIGSKLFAIPVIIIGIYLVLQMTGLTNLAMTVIGGTGLLGVVIGLAFKDIAENFLSSVLISVRRPFKTGDYIMVDGHEGVVQSVTTRGTVIMTLDGNHIQIPNSIIYKNTIVNVTANPNIRKQFTVGIGSDDSITNAQKIALDVLNNHEAILSDPEPQVLVDSLGAATVNIIVYFWVNGKKNSASKVKSAMIRLIKKAYDDAQIMMPDEAREVVFPEGIHITQQAPDSPQVEKPVKQSEPEANEVETDLSNDVDIIRKQSEENQLTDESENLLKD